MGRHSSQSDQELFQQLEVIRDVATNVKEKTERGQESTLAAEAVARIIMVDTKSIIEELQQRGYGSR